MTPPRYGPFNRRLRLGARHGAILIAALACLLVVTTILAAMIESALRARRQLHVQRDLRQTELLVEAGAARAAFRLARDADYRGEVWSVPAEELLGTAAGEVTLEAARDTGDAPWQVRIVAHYPFGSERSIRRSRTFLVTPTLQNQE